MSVVPSVPVKAVPVEPTTPNPAAQLRASAPAQAAPPVASNHVLKRVPTAGQARPILARDADSTYWMARYVERAENVARLLLVTREALSDVRDVAPALLEKQWQTVLRIMHVEDPPHSPNPLARRIQTHMTFTETNPNSLVSCLTRARENARGIREGISSDMWEHLNGLYWSIRAEDSPSKFQEAPEHFFQQVITGAMAFEGLTDQTLQRDQRWHFTRLGRYFERIAFTCRTLQEKSRAAAALDEHTGGGDASARNVQWAATLRCCNSHEAYRRHFPGELDPASIAAFLLLEPRFPRSVRHCVAQAKAAIEAIREEVKLVSVDPAERILGRLQAELDYAEVDEVLGAGLSPYLDRIQQQTAQAALAIQKSYFLH